MIGIQIKSLKISPLIYFVVYLGIQKGNYSSTTDSVGILNTSWLALFSLIISRAFFQLLSFNAVQYFSYSRLPIIDSLETETKSPISNSIAMIWRFFHPFMSIMKERKEEKQQMSSSHRHFFFTRGSDELGSDTWRYFWPEQLGSYFLLQVQ